MCYKYDNFYVITLFISCKSILDANAARIAANTVPIVLYEMGCPYAVSWIGIPYRYLNIAVRSSLGIILYKKIKEHGLISALVK